MKKLKSIIQFIILLVVLPLVGNMTLLLTWPVLCVSFAIVLLLWSQPVLDYKESVENQSTDKNTMLLIVLMSSLGQFFSITEWAYWHKGFVGFDFFSLLGIMLLVFGISFRIWAIHTLDKAFSSTVQIKEGQQLITTGPYKWFRHPSYTGAWLLLMGIALVFHSWAGLFIMGPGMLWIYSKRMAVEENILTEAFGKAYIDYASGTWRMLPAW